MPTAFIKLGEDFPDTPIFLSKPIVNGRTSQELIEIVRRDRSKKPPMLGAFAPEVSIKVEA
jgi:hypothetical protein